MIKPSNKKCSICGALLLVIVVGNISYCANPRCERHDDLPEKQDVYVSIPSQRMMAVGSSSSTASGYPGTINKMQ